jgi:hypothetical protein
MPFGTSRTTRVTYAWGYYYIFSPMKLAYQNTAKYLTILFGSAILIVAFFVIFEDQLFTGNDAKKLVEEQNIRLRDKYELLDNSSSSAMGGDYFHTFTLKISENDKREAIRAIKSSRNFKTDIKLINSSLYLSADRYLGPTIIQNYETAEAYVREYFKPSGTEGYTPTFRRISISKTENKLTFEDINE